MRSQICTTFLLLAASVLSTPTPGGKDSNCKTVKPGQKIQQAIDNARPGDKITVEPGTYSEQLTISKSDITLFGKQGAIITPPSTFTKNTCTGLNEDFTGQETEAGICITGKDIVLDEFNQEHRKVLSVGQYVKNVVVSGFEVRGFSGENIAVVGGKDVKVTGNTLVDGPQYGFLSTGSKNTLAEGNTVKSSTFGFIAMCMDDQFDTKFKSNDISSYVIALCTQTSGAVVKKNTVKNCCIGPFVDPGIKDATVVENTITDRSPICDTFDGSPAAGIIVNGARNTVVKNNLIQRINNNSTMGVGIFINDDAPTGLQATGTIVKQNSLEGNDFDIINNSTSTDNVLKNNNCLAEKSAPGNYCK